MVPASHHYELDVFMVGGMAWFEPSQTRVYATQMAQSLVLARVWRERPGVDRNRHYVVMKGVDESPSAMLGTILVSTPDLRPSLQSVLRGLADLNLIGRVVTTISVSPAL